MTKNALITGADRGMGYRIAEILSKHQYNICINYLYDDNAINRLCKKIEAENKVRAIGFRADVSINSELQAMYLFFEKNFGCIHLLINNAGITEFSPFLETTEQLWKKIMFTDFKGAYFSTQLAAKNMIKYGVEGVIINISSNHAQACWPEASVYGCAKAALSKMGKHAALELSPYRIRVITIEPGYTNTGWKMTTALKRIKNKIPLKRFATPEEISELILFLASSQASYITGCSISVDGGAVLPVVTENFFDSEGVKYE